MAGDENRALASVHNCHRCDYKPACLYIFSVGSCGVCGCTEQRDGFISITTKHILEYSLLLPSGITSHTEINPRFSFCFYLSVLHHTLQCIKSQHDIYCANTCVFFSVTLFVRIYCSKKTFLKAINWLSYQCERCRNVSEAFFY